MPLFRCVSLERAATRWAPLPGSVSKPEAHIATIDALRLFRANHKLFSLSGSRDRQIKLWDMQTATNLVRETFWIAICSNLHFRNIHPRTDGNAQQVRISIELVFPMIYYVVVDKAHGGWVWSLSLAQSGQAFYSAGWDSLVKQWRIAEAQILVGQFWTIWLISTNCSHYCNFKWRRLHFVAWPRANICCLYPPTVKGLSSMTRAQAPSPRQRNTAMATGPSLNLPLE